MVFSWLDIGLPQRARPQNPIRPQAPRAPERRWPCRRSSPATSWTRTCFGFDCSFENVFRCLGFRLLSHGVGSTWFHSQVLRSNKNQRNQGDMEKIEASDSVGVQGCFRSMVTTARPPRTLKNPFESMLFGTQPSDPFNARDKGENTFGQTAAAWGRRCTWEHKMTTYIEFIHNCGRNWRYLANGVM